MDAVKYGNLIQYVKNRVYPSNFTKQEKAVLCRFAKKLELDAKSNKGRHSESKTRHSRR